MAARFIEILKTGPLALVEDLGRPGYGAVGVGVSGAADRTAHRLANRLVGNPPDAATIEVTLGGLSFGTNSGLCLALTGALVSASVSGRGVGYAAPFYMKPGEVFTMELAQSGLRSYVAIAGGVDVKPVLGSRATDILSGLGPAPLAKGSVLRIGHGSVEWPQVDVAPVLAPTNEPVTLTVVRGPRDDWLASYAHFLGATWTASSNSDRVGVRLEGDPLDQAPAVVGGQLASEGVARGSIQVPPSGLPVCFLVDHPVTGGYPVVAVLTDADTDRLAQVRPGQRLRFVNEKEYHRA